MWELKLITVVGLYPRVSETDFLCFFGFFGFFLLSFWGLFSELGFGPVRKDVRNLIFELREVMGVCASVSFGKRYLSLTQTLLRDQSSANKVALWLLINVRPARSLGGSEDFSRIFGGEGYRFWWESLMKQLLFRKLYIYHNHPIN